jgi:nitrite reductase/ring-hydroxylating ferredoxin subunit
MILVSCKDEVFSPVPNSPVYLDLNLTATYPTFKNSVNQVLLFEKPIKATDRVGCAGVVVCTGFDGVYYAFDMCCPHEAKSTTKVRPNKNGQVVCDSCHTVFDIGYGIGNPSSGVSKYPLKKYKAYLSGDVLYISN